MVRPVSHSFFTCELVQRPCYLAGKAVTFITELLAAEGNLQWLPAARTAVCMKIECIEYCHLWSWWRKLVDFHELTLCTGKERHCVVRMCVNGRVR